MFTKPQDILEAFDVLPVVDQRAVAAEIVRRAGLMDYLPLSEEELSLQANILFSALDAAEEERTNGQ